MTYYGARHLADAFRAVRKNTIGISEATPAEQYGYRAAPRVRMVRQAIFAVAFLAIQGVHVSAQDVPPLRNFLQVNKDFCTGAQPRPEHLAKLKEDGVKAVLNLRVPTEHRAKEEQAYVKKLGMKYFNIPVSYQGPTDEQVDEFLKLTDDPANRPMFIHCTAAIRVGAFWMIRRVMRDGMSIDAALAEAKKVGLVNAPHLEEFARAYLAKHGKAGL
jgi:uncharacterized protein (TIGR01244 family)